MIKLIPKTIAILFFLIVGLYLNYYLQKDFLVEIGFDGIFVMLTIIFFDAGKIFSEYLFLSIKTKLAKLILGLSAIILILLSIYITFAVRNWKSINKQELNSKQKELFQSVNDKIKAQKYRIDNQLKSIDKQIEVKRKMMIRYKERRDRWIVHNYNKNIVSLNKQKQKLINKVNNLEDDIKFDKNQKITLQFAMTTGTGVNGQKLDMITNFIIAVMVDGLILLYIYGLTYIWKDVKKALSISIPIKKTKKVAKSKTPIIHKKPKKKIVSQKNLTGHDLKSIISASGMNVLDYTEKLKDSGLSITLKDIKRLIDFRENKLFTDEIGKKLENVIMKLLYHE